MTRHSAIPITVRLTREFKGASFEKRNNLDEFIDISNTKLEKKSIYDANFVYDRRSEHQA